MTGIYNPNIQKERIFDLINIDVSEKPGIVLF